MDKDDILNVFREFAQSQGFYGRLLMDIGWNGEYASDEFWEQFKGCTDTLDVLMVIEGLRMTDADCVGVRLLFYNLRYVHFYRLKSSVISSC